MFAAENIFLPSFGDNIPNVQRCREITCNHVKSFEIPVFLHISWQNPCFPWHLSKPWWSLGLFGCHFSRICWQMSCLKQRFFLEKLGFVKASLQRPSYNRSVFVEGESTKKQDLELEHNLGGTRGAPKSTIVGTKESTKKHGFLHEGKHQTSPFFARRKALK